MNQDRPLGRLLISVLCINIALLVAVLFDQARASGPTRMMWLQVALTGVAVVLIARALKVSSEMRTQVRRLLDLNRLLF